MTTTAAVPAEPRPGSDRAEPGRWSGWFASTAPSTAAAVTVSVAGLLLWGWRSAVQIPDGGFWSGWGLQALDLGLAVLIGVVGSTLLVVVCRLLGRRPSWWLWWSVITVAFLVATMGGGASPLGWLIVAGLLLIAVGVVAAAGVAALGGDHSTLGRRSRRTGKTVTIGAGLLVIALVGGFLAWPGGGAPGSTSPAVADGVTDLPASAADSPSGTVQITETRYGSGRPGPNAEYGPGVPIVTAPVDASRIIGGWGPDSTRTGVWGFDAGSLPLNGTVWTPTTGGPFPLVVLVHGNSAFDHSERGLRYLGESLASRGYAAVAIDENFLSTGVFDRSDPLTGANAARAWLILQHVRQFVDWNTTAGSTFAGRIDVSRISLVGHSRGGEAVAVAAALNTMTALPDDPSVTFSSGFSLRTVIALAPSDGQYLPRGEGVVLRGVNYLAVAGTMDADVGTFAGARQFARVVTDDTHIAAAVAIHRANHTQFNADWGRRDVGLGAAAYLLATGPLLSPAEQQQATTGLVGAFLDLTVDNRPEYRGLFDATASIPSWLPDTVYVRRFAAGDGAGLSHFDNADAITHPWGVATVSGGSGAVVQLPTKLGPSTERVLELTATADETSYTVAGLTAGRIRADATITVDAGTDAADAGIGITARAVTSTGRTIDIGLRPWQTLPDHLDGRTLKPLLPGGADGEVLLQTYSVPVSALADQDLDPAQITELSIVLNGAAGHRVYLDNVGMR